VKTIIVLTSLFLFILYFQLSLVTSVNPTGANITEERTETAPADTAGTHQAQAGNVTELNIFGYSTTQTWQGYFGNVSGVIQLADSGDNVLYNWTLANPQGEVYSSTNETISWTKVQCFNFTATGSQIGDTTGGGTSLNGTNLTTLENEYNILSSDVDGVDETFTLLGAGTHDLFYVANQQFNEGECRNTRVFGSSGAGVSNQFEEAILYEPTTSSIIFTALLEDSNILGFDSRDYDFEMLVLEDGHGTNIDTTTYYFFVEIE